MIKRLLIIFLITMQCFLLLSFAAIVAGPPYSFVYSRGYNIALYEYKANPCSRTEDAVRKAQKMIFIEFKLLPLIAIGIISIANLAIIYRLIRKAGREKCIIVHQDSADGKQAENGEQPSDTKK